MKSIKRSPKLTSLLFLFLSLLSVLSACSPSKNSEASYGAIILYEDTRYRGHEALKISKENLTKIGEISKRVSADTSPTENLSSNALDEGTEVFQDDSGNLFVNYPGGDYQIFKKDNIPKN
ncbi:hypothetical protein [Saccharibacillus qingshengii]|uniref:hypothetical protein n=1 Tax=Saccharibacillus qingshengii TaxID=1763540 RepID=UPI001555CCF9|nr:hypothetical protein [Saccharibacillus qingshengii]